MAVNFKPTKPKKEKQVKAPKEPKAPRPSKKDNTVNLKISKPAKAPKTPKAERLVKVKREKPVKVKQESHVKIKQQRQPKGAQPLNTVNLKKNSGSGARKPKNVKSIIGISISLVVVIALISMLLVIVIGANKQGNEIGHISISSTPNKTTYYVGEEADYEGLKITVTRRNGKQTTVPISKCIITGFDNTEPAEKQTISVQYEGFIATFSITVKETPKPTSTLVGIYLEELPKIEYKADEWLDTSGGVIVREYKDGTTKRISLVNSYVYGWEAAQAAFEKGEKGPYTLTVKYKEGGILVETTYEITITE
ncbi:MAG: bacterial Ig-like domain-containing protein [Clostridia bacterium]|nr:bacterial Ig-like domain-containing protein [Clostridia bacterium]